MSTPHSATQCSIACNLCEATDVEQIRSSDRHGDFLRSVICRRCGLVYSDPRPSPEQLRNFYAHEYRLGYKGTYQPMPKHTYRAGKVAIERFQRLRPFLTPACRVFDIGAGSGEMVYVLRAMGYDASGVEPNEGYANYAAESLGVPVTQGFWQDAAFARESADLVTMFHVVEHLENPFQVMCHARQWLRPGGLLLVEVPNIEAVCQQPHTQFHTGHLYHFNLATLGAMHERAGYEVVHRATSPDGGNIAAISRMTGSSPAAPKPLNANYEQVASILKRHTPFRHLLSPYPIIRPLRKLAARWDEQRRVRTNRPARELLDALIQANST